MKGGVEGRRAVAERVALLPLWLGLWSLLGRRGLWPHRLGSCVWRQLPQHRSRCELEGESRLHIPCLLCYLCLGSQPSRLGLKIRKRSVSKNRSGRCRS